MKVKVLVRNPDDYQRETKRDIHKVPRNFEPSLHPFEVAREYQRALNSAKLERIFAKPFICALDGHTDGVHCVTKHPISLSTILSGSYNGEVKVWHLASKLCTRTIHAHSGFIRGLCVGPSGSHFYTVGDDKNIKQWQFERPARGEKDEPTNTIITKSLLTGIDHNWSDNTYATSGTELSIWDEERAEPVRTYTWGVDTLTSVKFNPIQTSMLASTANDRSIILYDARGTDPVRKLVLEMRTNAVAWNPMEAFIFTAANEDYNLYTFDIRKLNRPVNIHMDHVSAVLDVDYSPTGKEFVSGSFDKTIRIFNSHHGRSREVYHTKRMQKVFTVKWTMDNKYIISGSDEMNLRLWKAHASDKLGMMNKREADSINYATSLKEKYAPHPKVKRILRHRHVPQTIYHASKELNIMKQTRKKRNANKRAHSKPGVVPYVSERDKHIVNEYE